MNAIQVHIVSAEEEIFSGEVNSVFASAEMGEIGILPNHCPLLANLRPGTVRLVTEGQNDMHFYVSGGILEVQPHIVTVLADTALRSEDLDASRALEAKKRAEESLASKQTDIETAAALAEIAEATAQLRMIEELRKLRR